MPGPPFLAPPPIQFVMTVCCASSYHHLRSSPTAAAAEALAVQRHPWRCDLCPPPVLQPRSPAAAQAPPSPRRRDCPLVWVVLALVYQPTRFSRTLFTRSPAAAFVSGVAASLQHGAHHPALPNRRPPPLAAVLFGSAAAGGAGCMHGFLSARGAGTVGRNGATRPRVACAGKVCLPIAAPP
jgi:hypothetical protein